MSAIANALRQAGINALKAGRLEEAIRSLQQAADHDPETYETFAYLGAAYARLGDYERSRRAFGRAVQIQPRSAKARYNLGSAHQMAGDTEAARVCFEATLALDPNYTAAREALDKLPPKVVNLWELASPGGAVRLPGAHRAEMQPSDEAGAEPQALTPEEIARLAAPQGHLHLMGAQASEPDHAAHDGEHQPSRFGDDATSNPPTNPATH